MLCIKIIFQQKILFERYASLLFVCKQLLKNQICGKKIHEICDNASDYTFCFIHDFIAKILTKIVPQAPLFI